MSVTIAAAPVALGYVIVTTLISGVTLTTTMVDDAQGSFEQFNVQKKNEEQSLDTINIGKEDIEQICKNYTTVITDRELLMKTLKEHGVDNIAIKGDSINTKISEFNLLFSRTNMEMPYNLKVFTDCQTNNDEELINELFGEYCINTQEANYKKIKERLEQKNLQIDEEEILDDNSIMLTINLS